MNPVDVTELISKLGYPIVISLFACYGLWKINQQTLQDGRQREERLLNRLEENDKLHITLLDTNKELAKTNEFLAEDIMSQLQTQEEFTTGMSQKLDKLILLNGVDRYGGI